MKHLFKKGERENPTLLLLHGTGGNEHDLLPLADYIDPKANVLSVRGNVLETECLVFLSGSPRVFSMKTI